MQTNVRYLCNYIATAVLIPSPHAARPGFLRAIKNHAPADRQGMVLKSGWKQAGGVVRRLTIAESKGEQKEEGKREGQIAGEFGAPDFSIFSVFLRLIC